MPHVNVTVIGNAPSQEQKSALFSKISNLLVTLLSEGSPEGGRIDDRNTDDFNLGRRSMTCLER